MKKVLLILVTIMAVSICSYGQDLRVSGVKATASAFGVSENDTFFGMNFGAGFDVKLSKILFFNLEPKYMLTFIGGEAGHSFTTSAGLIFRF